MTESQDTHRTFWLIERVIDGRPHWLAWRDREQPEWVTDATKADQYDWAVAAQQEARKFAVTHQVDCFATEHMWIEP